MAMHVPLLSSPPTVSDRFGLLLKFFRLAQSNVRISLIVVLQIDRRYFLVNTRAIVSTEQRRR